MTWEIVATLYIAVGAFLHLVRMVAGDWPQPPSPELKFWQNVTADIASALLGIALWPVFWTVGALYVRWRRR
jgi:hypothetical protein